MLKIAPAEEASEDTWLQHLHGHLQRRLQEIRASHEPQRVCGRCEMIRLTDEADVGHEAAVVVVVGAAGDGVRRHLAVHVEVSESRPAATTRHNKMHVITSASISRSNAANDETKGKVSACDHVFLRSSRVGRDAEAPCGNKRLIHAGVWEMISCSIHRILCMLIHGKLSQALIYCLS